MPRITFEQSSQYGGTGFWFSLADDGAYAEAIILAEKLDDVPIFALHDVEAGNSSVRVNCLREAGGSVNECPLCAAGHRPIVKLFLPILIDNQIRIWERGKTFYPKLKSLFRRYPEIFKCTFEIERIGEKGSTGTQYDFHFISEDKNVKSLDDLLQDMSEEDLKILDILGTALQDWSDKEMEEYIATGKNPNDKSKNSSASNSRSNSNHKETSFRSRGSVSRGSKDTEQDDEEIAPRRPSKKAPSDEEDDF